MEAVFLKLLNMSITAGWIVLALIIIRPLLRKAPKWISCALWALVGLRLILPISIESITSLIPSKETIPQDIVYQVEPGIKSGVDIINSAVNPVISEAMAPSPFTSVNPLQTVSATATRVWIIGMVVMVLYSLVSYIYLRRKVKESLPYTNSIWICDHISTPFLLGFFKPKIYLPTSMGVSNMESVIAHEQAHLKRKDHWWKPIGFVLLTVYWFNPLLWVAYVLLCRDIEIACDEKVIGKMSAKGKISYSEALLNCSISRRSVVACPLAFGEVGVKARIKSVLNYKKPAFWIIMAALLTSVIVAVCFLTDPLDTVLWQDGSSNRYDVLMSISSAECDAENVKLEIKWENKSEHTISLGMSYKIYREENGEWVEWLNTVTYPRERGLKAGNNYSSINTFTTSDFKAGEVYRLESEFSIPDLDVVDKKIWVEFSLRSEQEKTTHKLEATSTVGPELTPYPTFSATSEHSSVTESELKSNGVFEYTTFKDFVCIYGFIGNESKVVIPEKIDGKTVTDFWVKEYSYEHVTEITFSEKMSAITIDDLDVFPNLEKITFMGDAPGCFMVQMNTPKENPIPKDLKVYYEKGAKGFTSPSWNGFKCAEIGSEAVILSAGDYQYIINSDNTITIFRYTGNAENLVIPERIRGKRVTSVGALAFTNSNFLVTVKIPDSVTDIGVAAFAECTSLKTVKGGKNIKTIQDRAFSGCYQLSDIILPDGLAKLGTKSFSSCGLKKIYIPGTVKVVEYGTFLNSKLEKVTFNEGTEFIESLAFSECAIKSLEFPESMKTVFAMAFLYTPVETVKLNEGLENIHGEAFRATEIKEVVIPATVKEIYDSSFAGSVDIKFEGDAPEMFDSDYGLLSKESTIYYHEGAKGFTSPEWNGYKSAIW